MADFFPLINRAIQLLPQTATFEDRNSIYNKARAALERQLRSVHPPLSNENIDQELLTLEASIAKVEQDLNSQESWPDQVKNKEVHLSSAQDAEKLNQRPNDKRPNVVINDGLPPKKVKKTSLVLAAGLPVIAGLMGVFGILAYQNRLKPADFKVTQPSKTNMVIPVPSGTMQDQDKNTKNPEAPEDVIPVAVRASLYEEDSANSQLRIERRGAVVWRLENNAVDQGTSAPQTLRGNMEFPDAKLNVEFILRRNLDASFPASHTISLRFLPTSTEAKTVMSVSLPEFRAQLLEKGPVIQAVKAPDTDNSFLIAMLNTEPFMSTNIELLKKPGWLFFEVRFNDGKRAELVFEKGVAGQRAFEDAFAAWGE